MLFVIGMGMWLTSILWVELDKVFDLMPYGFRGIGLLGQALKVLHITLFFGGFGLMALSLGILLWKTLP